ncbi:MAG: beta-lactamase family protein [Oscillospiraceae bacterium]|nr:beta-lactamase family protein [Oscillospiraceae bacterium]
MKRFFVIIIVVFFLTGCLFDFPEKYELEFGETEITTSEYTDTSAPTATITETAEPAETEPVYVHPHERFDLNRLSLALSDTSQITEDLEIISNRYRATGMSVAVFVNGEIIYTFNHGFSDKGANIKTNDDTKYRVSSLSKTVTAVCAMMLVDSGELDLDRTVSDIMGFDMDIYHDTPNTTRHLLTHTSNIIHCKAYEDAFTYRPPLTIPQMLERGIWSADIPGSRYNYSNFGAALVGAVIESITNERFYRYADDNLFSRLNMDAGYLRTLITDTDNIANIYKEGELEFSVKTWGRTESLYNGIPLGQSYGLSECELIISASDLAKIGIMLSGDGSVDGVQILSQESVDLMNTVYITTQNKAGYIIGQGLQLRIYDYLMDGRVISGHPGQALGTVGGLYFDPADGTGVAILTNGCDLYSEDNGLYSINNDVLFKVYAHFFN